MTRVGRAAARLLDASPPLPDVAESDGAESARRWLSSRQHTESVQRPTKLVERGPAADSLLPRRYVPCSLRIVGSRRSRRITFPRQLKLDGCLNSFGG